MNSDTSNPQAQQTQQALPAPGRASVQETLLQQEQQWQQMDKDLHVTGASPPPRGLVTMIMGKLGTWKTTTAALWPKPVFLSIAKEGGDKSLGQLPAIWGIAPPPFYNITSIAMMNQKVDFICNNWQHMSLCSVIVDSVTQLLDMWISELLQIRAAELAYSKRKRITEIEKFQAIMEISDWGRLENYACRTLAEKLHSSGLNVVYVTHLKDKVKTARDGPRKGEMVVEAIIPDMQGATGRKLPTLCDLLLYAKKEQRTDPKTGRPIDVVVYYTQTPLNDKMIDLRHRFGLNFPDGRLVDPDWGDWRPTFRAIQQQIGAYIRS